MFPKHLIEKTKFIIEQCASRHITLAFAESCTGGLLSAVFTEISGASEVFLSGYVVYANQAKIRTLGIEETMLATYGAVSKEIALAMAAGAKKQASSTLAVGITGVAGPSGGTEEKPVGLVHIAAVCEGRPTLHEACHFSGDRHMVRMASVEKALSLIEQLIT